VLVVRSAKWQRSSGSEKMSEEMCVEVSLTFKVSGMRSDVGKENREKRCEQNCVEFSHKIVKEVWEEKSRRTEKVWKASHNGHTQRTATQMMCEGCVWVGKYKIVFICVCSDVISACSEFISKRKNQSRK
jgi:hypothetical protein